MAMQILRYGVIGLFLMTCAGVVHARTITCAGLDSIAISEAISQAQPGDVVFLPAGKYTLSQSIILKSDMTLCGAGQDRTILRFSGEKPSAIVEINNCTNTKIHDLIFDGMNHPNAGQGIAGYNSRNLEIRNVTVRNLQESGWGPHGILFSGDNPTEEHGVTDSIIADCLIENIAPENPWGSGIRLAWGSSRNQVIGCRVDNTGRGGIFGADGSNELIIRNNLVTRSHGEQLGIEVWRDCEDCVIEDNNIDHWLSIGGCDRVAVRRNVISCKTDDFGFIGIETIGSYCIVTDNIVDDGAVIGLSISGNTGKHHVFYGRNTFRACSQWGAQFQGEETGAFCQYLYRCRFIDNTKERGEIWYPGDDGHGFRVNGNCRDFVLEECDIVSNARLGMQFFGPNTINWEFNRCNISNNSGAVTSGAPEGALEWQDCKVEGNFDNTLPPAIPFTTPAPVVAFSAPETILVGEKVQFTSQCIPGSGEISATLWDLDDGAPKCGNTITHTYTQPGEYTVTLIAWDTANRAARAEQIIKVMPK